ncbi:MAG: putative peptide ABC transporter, permease protein [Osedax symbiont Rs2]|nr:MAG: putative peptide ABC transporter, permease protein [Osedax symbiont Rs2]
MAATAMTDEPSFLTTLLARRSVVIALGAIGTIIFMALFANWLTPYELAEISIRNRLTPPGTNWWLGSDSLGRDVYTRLLYAGQISLSIGLVVALISSLCGILIGLLAGYFSKLDAVLSRVIDAMMAFPDILLAIALVAALGGSMINIIIALSIVYTPRIARIVRASTFVIRELAYVEAARALGVSTWRILIFHLLRNMVSPIMVQATFIFAYAMLSEAGLSFLGVGVDPSTPTWGTMINEGRQYLDQASYLILAPGLAITVSVLALQIIGDGLRDALDPRIAKEL